MDTEHLPDEGDRPADLSDDPIFINIGVPRALAAPDSARNRAQAGYAISSAIAASIVAVGAFADIEDRQPWVQVAGAVAVVFWIVTALLYLRAVTTADSSSLEARGAGWLSNALENSLKERRRVDKALKYATLATILSVVATAPALGLAFGSSVSLDKDRVTLSLSNEGVSVVTRLCGKEPREVRGELESRTLTRDFVVIELDEGLCGNESLIVRLPKADILGIANE